MKKSLVGASVLAIVMSTGVLGATEQNGNGPTGQNRNGQGQNQTVPEPATILLVGVGAAAAIGARKLSARRRKDDRAVEHRTRVR